MTYSIFVSYMNVLHCYLREEKMKCTTIRFLEESTNLFFKKIFCDMNVYRVIEEEGAGLVVPRESL